MFNIEIYEDKNGKSELKDFLYELNKEALTSKFSRVRLRKIVSYIEALKMYGTRIGSPQVKHIVNTNLWELRPIRDRIFFMFWKDDSFILLNHFVKKHKKHQKRRLKKHKEL